MDKKNIGKYIVVFEPKYANCQFAVYLDDEKTNVTTIKKYTDLPLDGRKSPVKKNTLRDIDRVLTSLNNEEDFFKKYVDQSVFRYHRGSLHKMFIAYKQNQRIYTLPCEFNNPRLHSKLDLVSGSKIHDPEGISKLINFATDTSDNNKFLSFAENAKKEQKTGISSQTLTLLARMKVFKKMSETYQYTNSEILDEQRYLDELLNENLTSYKEYRELFLLRNAYGDAMEQERIKLESMKQNLTTPKKNAWATEEFKSQPVEQLNFFGPGYQKIK